MEGVYANCTVGRITVDLDQAVVLVNLQVLEDGRDGLVSLNLDIVQLSESHQQRNHKLARMISAYIRMHPQYLIAVKRSLRALLLPPHTLSALCNGTEPHSRGLYGIVLSGVLLVSDTRLISILGGLTLQLLLIETGVGLRGDAIFRLGTGVTYIFSMENK